MKKLITIATITAFIAIAISAPSQSQEGKRTSSRDYSSGKNVYESTCQFCHGAAGDGNGPAAFALNPKPRNFTDPEFWKNTSKEEITQTIMSGHGRGMPAFRFSPEDIKEVIDYISHFRKSNEK